MNWEAIGAIGEIVGAFGVIATLLYLSIQVRSNSTAIKAQMYQARSHESGSRAGQISDSPYLADIYTKIGTPPSLDNYSQLSPEDITRLTYSELRFMRGLDNTIQQFELGLIPEEFMAEVRVTIKNRYLLWDRLGIGGTNRDTFKRYVDEARKSADA